MIPDNGPAIFLLWGGFMAALGVVAVLIFEVIDVETRALLFGAAAVMLAIVVALIALDAGGAEPAQLRAEPDISPTTVWLVASVVLLTVSAEVGFWLSLIAAGMILVGVAGLVRELRSQRRTLRETTGREEGV